MHSNTTLKNIHRYWFANDPIKTLHANTLTSSIPYGERFFVICVIPYLKKIKDKTLKKQTIRFIRQELNHSKAHFRLYLKVVKPFYPKLKIRHCLYQKFFMLIALLLGARTRLAIVAAMEHFTAISGAYYLQHPELTKGMNEQIDQLWRWHFIEEIEHKSVAFDIFHANGNHYFIRILGFFIAALFLLCGFIGGFTHMVCYDKLYKRKKFYQDLYAFFFSKSGLVRKLWRPYLRYLQPYFHPNKCA